MPYPPPLHTFADAGLPVEPLPPQQALEYFRRLVPAIGVKSPERWGAALEREAFTLAASADAVVLERVQAAIAEALATGEVTGAPAEIDAILDAAGVTHRNPGYAENVFRTNMMDSYNTGSQLELAEVSDTFPVWQYMNPDDGRSRPHHAKRNGKYYSSSVPFTEVRGTDIEDVAQCRCIPREVDKWEWAELQAAGATISEPD